MRIKIKIQLAPDRVWPFDEKRLYFLYTSDTLGNTTLCLPIYRGVSELIACREENIEQTITEQLLLSIGQFVNTVSPDHERFSDLVKLIEPTFLEFPVIGVQQPGHYRLGVVIFEVAICEATS